MIPADILLSFRLSDLLDWKQQHTTVENILDLYQKGEINGAQLLVAHEIFYSGFFDELMKRIVSFEIPIMVHGPSRSSGVNLCGHEFSELPLSTSSLIRELREDKDRRRSLIKGFNWESISFAFGACQILSDQGLLYEERLVLHPGTTKPTVYEGIESLKISSERRGDFDAMRELLKSFAFPFALETIPAISSYSLSEEAFLRVFSHAYGFSPEDMGNLLSFLEARDIDVKCLLDITHTMVAAVQLSHKIMGRNIPYNGDKKREIVGLSQQLLGGFSEFCIPLIHYSGLPYHPDKGFLPYDIHGTFTYGPKRQHEEAYNALVQVAKQTIQNLYSHHGKLAVVLEMPCDDKTELQYQINAFKEDYLD